ncbi:diphthine synthase [Methanoplanus sp. FWC-SCC4]|uniref:Diphthine synthase n=1 Tax=Methanochimaera problematica TaxID=2609417 RepID=A0AA97I4N0_9EURY|nr:diphthine synthase [Methanoplanus sp. FWC-SCC4]WOF16531.1 diphthine synthase [Methanoplanus sp. FWC-SCC4]
MLTFIGLGLYDEKDISVKGLECIKSADSVFLEGYTSRLMGADINKLEEYYGKKITFLGRADVEQHPENILKAAEEGNAVFLTGGDPMVSTTHADLRIRAKERGIKTGIIHAASIQNAVCGLSGLQNYRFGKSCSVPYPEKGWFPTTPLDTITHNIENDLHTLVFLDIKPDRHMTVGEGVSLIEQMAEKKGMKTPEIFVGIARAGSPEPVVIAGDAGKLKAADFGEPLHIIVVPAKLHLMEKEYLEIFAGL